MTLSRTTIAWLRHELKVLSEDAVDFCNSPTINDPELRIRLERIGSACRWSSQDATAKMNADLFEDLADIKNTLKMFSFLDNPLDEDRSYQTREFSKSARALRASIDDVLERWQAVSDVKVAEHTPELIPTALVDTTIVKEVKQRLGHALGRLNKLEAEVRRDGGSSSRQTAIVQYVARRFRTTAEISFSILSEEHSIDATALVRTLERQGALMDSCDRTVAAMPHAISEPVRRHIAKLRGNVRHIITKAESLLGAREEATRSAFSAPEGEADPAPVDAAAAPEDDADDTHDTKSASIETAETEKQHDLSRYRRIGAPEIDAIIAVPRTGGHALTERFIHGFPGEGVAGVMVRIPDDGHLDVKVRINQRPATGAIVFEMIVIDSVRNRVGYLTRALPLHEGDVEQEVFDMRFAFPSSVLTMPNRLIIRSWNADVG